MSKKAHTTHANCGLCGAVVFADVDDQGKIKVRPHRCIELKETGTAMSKQMTHKEIAERLRYIAEHRLSDDYLNNLADELDPPRPVHGTIVEAINFQDDRIVGYAVAKGIGKTSQSLEDGIVSWRWDEIESYTELVPASRVLAPDEVAVKVPPVGAWPGYADRMIVSYVGRDEYIKDPYIVATRAEAERMEAER